MERIYLPNSKNFFELNMIDSKKRNMVVIVPGGGYDHTSEREGIHISNAFEKEGFHTLILHYREQLDLYPVPMEELLYAINYVRENKLVDKVIAIGFSAGANLVGLASNYYMNYKEYNGRPDLDIICYPVVSSDKEYTHKGSFKYLLGENNLTKEKLKEVDVAHNCHKDFPPSFVWHTVNDEAVPLGNSLDLINALKENNIRFEYHIFPDGVHGLSLATKESAMGDERKINPYVQKWFSLALEFIKNTL